MAEDAPAATIKGGDAGFDWAALGRPDGLRKLKVERGAYGRRFFAELGRLARLRKLTLRRIDQAQVVPGSLKGLSNLKELAIEFQSDPLGALCAEFRHLTAVKTVALEFVTIDGPLAKGLAAMPNVESARFWGMETTDRAFRHLCGMTKLKSVVFCDEQNTPTPITAAGFRHIKTLGTLRSLELQGFEHVNATGWEALRELKRLRTLKVFSHPPFDYLERVGPLPSVVNLELTNCNSVTAAGWGVLPKMRALRSLAVSAWVARPYHPPFAQLREATQLRSLSLRDFTKTTDDDLALLGPLRRLEEFALHEAPRVTDAGLTRLRAFPVLRKVDVLDVPKLTDRGVAELAAVPNLRELRLRCTNRVTDAGYAALAGARKLESLTLMYARNLTGERLLALARALPLTELYVHDSPHLTDETCEEVARVRRFKAARFYGCKHVTAAGWEVLNGSPPGG